MWWKIVRITMWLQYRPDGTLARRLRYRPKNLTSSNHCLRTAMTSFKGTKCRYIKSSQWGSVPTVPCRCRSGLVCFLVLFWCLLSWDFFAKVWSSATARFAARFCCVFCPIILGRGNGRKNNFLFWIETNFRPPYPTPQTTHRPGNYNVSPSHGPDKWECETISRKFLCWYGLDVFFYKKKVQIRI